MKALNVLSKIKIPTPVLKVAAKMSKYSPEICIVSGIGLFVAATVTGIKTTATKASEIIELHNFDMDEAEEAYELAKTEDAKAAGVEYSLQDYKKDKAIIYANTVKRSVQAYWPTITFTLAGTACIFAGYKIMKARQVALIAAYTGLQNAYDAYRRRVLQEPDGEDRDLYYRTGCKRETITTVETDEKGKTTEKKEIVDIFGNAHDYSQYARYFDESSKQWQNSHEYNLTYLLHQQAYANDKLHAVGHVFLNEVYDMLGFPHTQAGAVVGWVEGNGDDYIDFGIHEGKVQSRKFVNGWENTILLDFNVDGVIVDKI